MEMVVNGQQADARVDGEFVGEYTLLTERLSNPGYLACSIVSDMSHNHDVRCEITDADRWIVE